MLPRSTEIQPCVASIRPSPSFSIQLSPKTWRGYPSDTCLYFYVLAFSSHRLHLPSACHGFGFALSWLRLVVPCLAMLCLGLGMPWPCVGMPRRAVALACLGLGLRMSWPSHALAWPWYCSPFNSSLFEKVRLLEAWHGVALACLAKAWRGLGMPCQGMAWPWHCPIQGISRK